MRKYRVGVSARADLATALEDGDAASMTELGHMLRRERR